MEVQLTVPVGRRLEEIIQRPCVVLLEVGARDSAETGVGEAQNGEGEEDATLAGLEVAFGDLEAHRGDEILGCRLNIGVGDLHL